MKRILSFKYAIAGIIHAIKHEPNAKIHLVATVIVVLMGFYFNIEKVEWLIIVVAIGIVITAELFNTAIENTIDFISPEINEKAGRIKDIAAGAVLFSALTAATIGIVIFGPRILGLF